MKIAVSACLLGESCRYDGKSKSSAEVLALRLNCELVPVCPEAAGGLRVPRLPSEIVASERAVRVVDAEGVDRTDVFLAGAAKTLERVRQEGCSLAVLKANSPSCGCGWIHDGTFTDALVEGFGVTARLLRAEGVRVIDEDTLRDCLDRCAVRHPGQFPGLVAGSSAECPALVTDRLVLRPLVTSDVDDVFAYCSDPDVGPDAGWAPHRTRDDARTFVEEVACAPHVFGLFERLDVEGSATISSEATGASGSVAGLPATGPCIGSIGLLPDLQRRNVDCLMLGYALAKWAWGRGYMTEASREVIRYGFEELGLSMITCNHYSFNDRSRRVIEKCGFAYEGTLHGVETTPDGIMRDAEQYYLTVAAWRS